MLLYLAKRLNAGRWLKSCSELISLGSQSVDFHLLGATDLVKRVKFMVSGHFLENALREWPEIFRAVVSSADHFHNWFDYGHCLLIFLLLVPLWLSEMGQTLVFWAFPAGEPMERMAWKFAIHADACLPPAELIRLGSRSVDFPHFGTTLT